MAEVRDRAWAAGAGAASLHEVLRYNYRDGASLGAGEAAPAVVTEAVAANDEDVAAAAGVVNSTAVAAVVS